MAKRTSKKKSKKTCGDFGGKNVDGSPCRRPAGWGTDRIVGRCKAHPEPSPFDNITHPKKRAFLAALSETGNKTRAAEIAGIERRTQYTAQWREDEEFQRAVIMAEAMAADLLEEEARRRAVEGVEEPVGWFRGVAGGVVRRYSDTLLIFLLKGNKPEKFCDRVEHSGPAGGPIPSQINIHLVKSDEPGDGD